MRIKRSVRQSVTVLVDGAYLHVSENNELTTRSVTLKIAELWKIVAFVKKKKGL